MGKLLTKGLTESILVTLPLCDHLDGNSTEAQLSWTLHGITHTHSCTQDRLVINNGHFG